MFGGWIEAFSSPPGLRNTGLCWLWRNRTSLNSLELRGKASWGGRLFWGPWLNLLAYLRRACAVLGRLGLSGKHSQVRILLADAGRWIQSFFRGTGSWAIRAISAQSSKTCRVRLMHLLLSLTASAIQCPQLFSFLFQAPQVTCWLFLMLFPQHSSPPTPHLSVYWEIVQESQGL